MVIAIPRFQAWPVDSQQGASAMAVVEIGWGYGNGMAYPLRI